MQSYSVTAGYTVVIGKKGKINRICLLHLAKLLGFFLDLVWDLIPFSGSFLCFHI